MSGSRIRMVIGEGLGTGLLMMVIVGSGITVQRMTSDAAVQLLLHAVAVGAGLAALVALLAGLSGAHLNPAVTTAFWRRGHLDTPTAVGFLAAQITGAVIGVGVAHIAFGERILAVSSQPRGGLGGTAAEFVGTLLLVLLIVRLVDDGRNSLIPPAVGAWVAAMVLSTPSGGFLNPAVTLARIFSDTYTGIAPGAALGFVAAQVIAGIGAGAVTGRLVKMREPKGS